MSTDGYDWAVFNDEGCLEQQQSYGQATADAAGWRAEGDEGIYVDRECGEHEQQPQRTCQDCSAEPVEDEDEDAEVSA